MRALAAILGLLVGLGLGLVYAWVISPVEYTDVEPAMLNIEAKREVMQLIAAAYATEGDVTRARARLASLGESDSAQAVTALAQQLAASGGEATAVQNLAALAAALGGQPSAVTPIAPAASATPPPTATTPPTVPASPTALLTATPIVLPGLPTSTPLPGRFGLTSTETLCAGPRPLLQIVTQDAAGNGVPGVEVIVEWAGGQDRFFTGLKPQLGAGYGDFEMTPAIEYTVRLAEAPDAAYAARSEPCTDNSGNFINTSVRLVFAQP